MKKIVIAILLFLIHQNVYSQKGSCILLTKNDKNYLQYKYMNETKKILIPGPLDTAIFEDKILYYNKGKSLQTSYLEKGELLIAAISDFDYSVKCFLFFINKKTNTVLFIERISNNYLETGLPFFLISSDGDVVVSNCLSFIDSQKEISIVHYYKVSDEKIEWKKDKTYTFKEQDINERDFISKKIYLPLIKSIRH